MKYMNDFLCIPCKSTEENERLIIEFSFNLLFERCSKHLLFCFIYLLFKLYTYSMIFLNLLNSIFTCTLLWVSLSNATKTEDGYKLCNDVVLKIKKNCLENMKLKE